jgi:hypothetical protein
MHVAARSRARQNDRMSFDREPKPGKATAIDHDDAHVAVGKTTAVEHADMRNQQPVASAARAPSRKLAVGNYNNAVRAVGTMKSHVSPVGNTLASTWPDSPWVHEKRVPTFEQIAKARSDYDRLWKKYNDVCRAPTPIAPQAEANVPHATLPPDIVTHLNTLGQQIRAAKEFLQYVIEAGAAVKDAIELAQENLENAEKIYEGALKTAVSLADYDRDEEEYNELEEDFEDA